LTQDYISIAYADAEVRKALNLSIAKLRNPKPFLNVAREIILLEIDRGFEEQRSPNGEKWTSNTPYTIAQKRAQKRINKVLQSTGRGRASINGEVVGDRLIVGTPIRYMARHQLGTGVPKREFLGISTDAKKEILNEAAIYATSSFSPES
jgi:phage gpG-like protein